MYDIFGNDTAEFEDSTLSLMALGAMLHKGDTKRLSPEVKKQLAEKYKAGLRFQLKSGSTVEVIMDADESDVYYSAKEDKIFIFLTVRRDEKEYQNVNMHLLKHGTCARDKYNQFPGMQYYTRDEWRILSKIPEIAKTACDEIMLKLIDFGEDGDK